MYWTNEELHLLWLYSSLSSRESWYIVSSDEVMFNDLYFIESQLLISNKLLIFYEAGYDFSVISFKDFTSVLSSDDVFIEDLQFHPINFSSLDVYDDFLSRILVP